MFQTWIYESTVKEYKEIKARLVYKVAQKQKCLHRGEPEYINLCRKLIDLIIAIKLTKFCNGVNRKNTNIYDN